MLNKLFKAHKDNREDGFTLIELLIVIVIVGILAAIAVPVFNNQQDASRNATVKSDVRNSITPVQTALISNPNALGFTVLAPGDTVAAISVLKASAIPVPTGYVAVHLTKSGGNDTVITNPDGTGSGSGSGYLIHGQNAKTGFWVEFNSTTGQFTSSAKTNAIPVVAVSRVAVGATSASVTPFTHAATSVSASAKDSFNCDVNMSQAGITQVTQSLTFMNTSGASLTGVNVNGFTMNGKSYGTPTPGFGQFTYAWPSSTAGTLAAGQSFTVTGKYTLAQLDLDKMTLSLAATANGNKASDGSLIILSQQSYSAPIPACAKLTVTKTAQIGASGSTGTVKAGDVITYSFNATNTGNETLNSISIASSLAGVSAPAINQGNLLPGASYTGISYYTITASDVAAGKVVDNSSFVASQNPAYAPSNMVKSSNPGSGSLAMTVLTK